MTAPLPTADLYRSGRPQELRTASGPPSDMVELPAALRGLIRTESTDREAPAMTDDMITEPAQDLSSEPGEDPETDDARPESANAEAAGYRRRLREAEATRDALAAKLEAATRRDAERTAAGYLRDPVDLWRHGVELADLLGESGLVDEAKLAAAIATVTADRPWLVPARRPAPDPAQGRVRDSAGPAPSWSGLLAKATSTATTSDGYKGV